MESSGSHTLRSPGFLHNWCGTMNCVSLVLWVIVRGAQPSAEYTGTCPERGSLILQGAQFRYFKTSLFPYLPKP